MPGIISVAEFIEETRQDVNSPTTSTFVSRMPQCRQTLATLEESLDVDRDGLTKMKKAVKAVNSSGTTHTENELYLSRALEGLGNISTGTGKEYEPHIVAAYIKFSVVTKELSALMKTLMQNLSNIVLFPVDSLLKGDLRGVRGDLKRPFDKTWKDYEAKYSKLEKEKKAQAKEAGFLRSEVTPAEVAEEMDKERKMFQLQMCEYLIRVNEIKTKKGVELLQHLVEYYHAQQNYFQDGLKTIEHFGSYVSDLAVHLQSIRQKQDEERKQLLEIRNVLKNSPGLEKEWNANLSNAAQSVPATGYSLHQLQGNKQHGLVKTGFLLKKSEGKMRKVWQKRRCEVRDGFLSIYHGDESKAPNRVNLLTCQIKPVQEDKKCFDVVSYNRTYHFQVEEESDLPSWISVLSNSKEGALQKAFNDNGKLGPKVDQALMELQNAIVKYIRRLPSNDRCADCYSQNDPTWLSTNFGIIVCIECSGVHRDMGVHISRIQSLELDHVPTSQLLIARHMSNHSFNEVMEETLHEQKPNAHSSMEKRIEFIRAKYIEKKFAVKRSSDARYLQGEMEDAIESGDLLQLLHAFVDGADFSAPFVDNDVNETALHLAIRREQGQTLHLIDFMVENTSSLDTTNREGDTPLHYCVRFNQPEAMKLLLRSGANIYIENKAHRNPVEWAKELGALECEKLLSQAAQNKKNLFDNVNVEWNLLQDDAGSSDEDYTVTEGPHIEATPDKKGRSRPPSLVMGLGIGTGGRDSPPLHSNSRSRSSTSESLSVTGSSPNSVTGRSNLPPPLAKKPPSTNMSTSAIITTSVTSQLASKKRAPLPPMTSTKFRPGHSRHASDVSVGSSTRGLPITIPSVRTSLHSPASLPGAKLVIPRGEPPTLKSVCTSNGGGSRPRGPPPPAPHASQTSLNHASSGLAHLSNGRSTESLASAVSDVDSVGHGSHHYKSDLRPRRCRALYDCVADNEDELPFNEGDILIVTVEQTEDDNWMEGYLQHDPRIKGVFPASFVYMLND